MVSDARRPDGFGEGGPAGRSERPGIAVFWIACRASTRPARMETRPSAFDTLKIS